MSRHIRLYAAVVPHRTLSCIARLSLCRKQVYVESHLANKGKTNSHFLPALHATTVDAFTLKKIIENVIEKPS